MRTFRTLREVFLEDFAEKREEAIDYLRLSLEEYQEDGDMPLFLDALEIVVASQGEIAKLAKQVELEPAALAALLSGNEGLPLDTFVLILKALGCRLTVEPLSGAMPAVEIARETAEGRVENVA